MLQSIHGRPAAVVWQLLLGTLLVLLLASCGGGGGPEPAPPGGTVGGTVGGLVVSASSGEALSGVAVTAGSRRATTGADGRYSLAGVPLAATQVVSFALAGHAPSHATVAVVQDSTSVANARLTPVGASVDFPASGGATIVVPNSSAKVVLPAAALVTASGASATGIVTARVTPIDPTADPANMPGNFTARTVSGGLETIESFGALNVQLSDASGARLNLAPGQTATIRIPLATRSTAAPATMPLYYFDEGVGLWVAEGAATLRGTAPSQYYEGTVGHFTTWNVDQPIETIAVTGCVQDMTGAPVTAPLVRSEGIDYSGSAVVAGAATGSFSVPMRRGGVALISADALGRTSNGVRIGPFETGTALSACLVLGDGTPVVTLQPTDQAGSESGFVVFQALATGNAPLRYQWQRSGVAVPGATGSSLRLSPLANADNGASYRVVVTNDVGSATSEPARLTVRQLPPLILDQPASVQVDFGAPASFAVQPSPQGAPLTFQWQRNGQAIPGATQASYTLAAAVSSDNGAEFRVSVNNAVASVVSSVARLTVIPALAPQITQQPASVTVTAGQVATFRVTATGSTPLTYQWKRNGQAIAGANAASYTTPAVAQADSGAVFSVTVGNPGGNVTSTSATLTVSAAIVAPQIVQSPQSAAVNAGSTATFEVTANGTSVAYQWQRNGVDIGGANAASYTTPATMLADSGASYTVRVSNSAGSVVSAAAVLTVQAVAPAISRQPQSVTVAIGQVATFSVSATGTAPLTYQWRRNGQAISGATSASYTTPAVSAGENGALFTVVVGNVANSATSNAATLTVTGTSGAGQYLLGFSGPSVQGAAIQFANGSQTIDANALSAVRAVSPTGASTIEAAGTAALLYQPTFEATVSGGQVSNLRERFAVYFKNGRLYKLDLLATGDVPTSQLVSSLTPNQVCGNSWSAQGADAANGIDLADATRSWIFLRGPGADGVCGTPDDRYRAVRLNMLATADALAIGEPLAEIGAANGAFAGLVVREGNLVRRLDANLLNPTTLFTLPAGAFFNAGVSYGGSLPGIWLFRAGDGLYGYDLASSALQPTRLATLSVGEQASSDLPIAAKGGLGYVALNGDTLARVLRLNGLAEATSVATGIGGTIEQIDATATRVVFLVRYDLGLTTLQSVPEGGGTATSLLQDDDTWITTSAVVSGENVYATQQSIDVVSSASVYRTVVVGADGGTRETRNGTAILGALFAASTPIASLGSDWYAVLLADNLSATTGYGGSTLRAEAGATRAPLVTYGQVQPTPESLVLPGGIGLLQYGQPGLLSYYTLGSSTAVDLIHFDSDAPGLTKVTNFNPTTLRAPTQRERALQLHRFALRKPPQGLNPRPLR